ncbi:hypothetical protein HQ524_04120 [Candidatus Uhrbacteria bacterium]|nr:hypothetical protein [Candidatus Uhrbacteria bacterium]
MGHSGESGVYIPPQDRGLKPPPNVDGQISREEALVSAEALFNFPGDDVEAKPEGEAKELNGQDWSLDDNNYLSFSEIPEPEAGVSSVRDITGREGNVGWKQDSMYDTSLIVGGEINGVDVSFGWNFDQEQYDVVIADRVDIMLGTDRGRLETIIEELKTLAGHDDGFLKNVKAIAEKAGDTGGTDYYFSDMYDENGEPIVEEDEPVSLSSDVDERPDEISSGIDMPPTTDAEGKKQKGGSWFKRLLGWD